MDATPAPSPGERHADHRGRRAVDRRRPGTGGNAGTLGDIATFSFHGTKTLTTGEGGMLVTDRSDLFERVAALARPRSHSRRLQVLRHRRAGLQVPDEQPAGRVRSGPAGTPRRTARAQSSRSSRWYEERLADIPGLRLNHRGPGSHNTFWMVTAVLDRCLRPARPAGLMDAVRRARRSTPGPSSRRSVRSARSPATHTA